MQHASASARRAYLATVAAGCGCYLVGWLYTFRFRSYNCPSALTVCLPIFGNLGNLLLYDSLGVNVLRLGAPG